jgi:hypothetical protein
LISPLNSNYSRPVHHPFDFAAIGKEDHAA